MTMEPAVESRFGVENLDTFRLDDKGVTFVYDFGFPHVSQALGTVRRILSELRRAAALITPKALGALIRAS